MTTATLRPNGVGVTTFGSVTVTGAASAWQALSDNSDASYVEFASAAFSVLLGTVTLPAGAVTKTLTVRYRASSPSGTSAANLFAADPTISTVYAQVSPSLSSATIVNGSGSPTAVTLAQAAIDAMVGYIATALPTLRLHEFYVDLVYALIPTVSVTAPTGAQGTPTPTVAWTYTAGSDGDVQSRYQVRVFTAAQYGIGGFDPATSPATWDSGIVLGAGVSAVTGVLPNSSTLRAYVNVAQTINGTPQWSGWSFSGFTTSFTTSDITSVVATPDVTNARHTIVVTRNGATPTWLTLELERSDDAGVTWAPVRGFTGGVAVTGATWPGTDYESKNGNSTLFRARATYINTGVTITGAWVQSSATTWTDANSDWLKDCRYTARNRKVTIGENPQLTRPRPQGINWAIGRRDPIVISDVRRNPNGTLTLVTLTDADAVDLLALTDGDVLLLQPRPSARLGQKYIAISGITEIPYNRIANQAERQWSLTFVEVAKPIDVGTV